MRHQPARYLAVLAVALSVLPGCKRSPAPPGAIALAAPTTMPAAPPPPPPPMVPTTARAAALPAPAPIDPDTDRRRRQLLALWDHAPQFQQSPWLYAGRPLYRAAAGSAFSDPSVSNTCPVAATLVSITNASTARQALIQIARQANVRITSSAPGLFQVDPPGGFSLQLDNKPLLEALHEICSRAGWKIEQIEPAAASATTQPNAAGPLGTIVLGPQLPNHGLGVWATSGPFLFEVTSLRHVADPAAPNGTHQMQIALRTWAEPKLCAFYTGNGISVRKAIDDRGGLLAPESTEAIPQMEPLATLYFNGARAFGRRLATLSLVDHCLIRRSSHRIELPLAKDSPGQTVEGITISAALDDPSGAADRIVVTAALGPDSRLDQGDLRTALLESRPRLFDDAGARMRFIITADATSSGPRGGVPGGGVPVGVEYSWWNMDEHGRPQHPGTLELDLPTDLQWVDVPVEFHDLPLP